MDKYSDRDARPLALVVDDDPIVRMDVVDMLGDLGFRVVDADCVRDALAYLEQNGDDVRFLLTDVQMPGNRTGVTLANHVSFIWPHIRILVTSGFRRPADGTLPVEVQFIAKPLTPNALMAYVATFPSDTVSPSAR